MQEYVERAIGTLQIINQVMVCVFESTEIMVYHVSQ